MHRYCDPNNLLQPCDPAVVHPPNVYIGGIEHAILHLLYARFITMFLYDQGLVNHEEPFPRLLTQGMVVGKTFTNVRTGAILRADAVDVPSMRTRAGDDPVAISWEKMSKSKYNGVDPTSVIDRWGADTTRLFTLFKAPVGAELQWDEDAIPGQHRFLARIDRLCCRVVEQCDRTAVELQQRQQQQQQQQSQQLTADQRVSLRNATLQSVAQITHDLAERCSFNTAIARLNELTNRIVELVPEPQSESPTCSALPGADPAVRLALQALLIMLYPFAPHIAADMWHRVHRSDPQSFVGNQRWPCERQLSADFDQLVDVSSAAGALADERGGTTPRSVSVVLQFGGRARGAVQLPVGAVPAADPTSGARWELSDVSSPPPELAALFEHLREFPAARRHLPETGSVSVVLASTPRGMVLSINRLTSG